MYYPYFRGKQFELIAIRESAEVLASSGFVPIVEPVRESLSSLERTLSALGEQKTEVVVIVNPLHGDHKASSESIVSFLADRSTDSGTVSPGVLLTSDVAAPEAAALLNRLESDGFTAATVVHAGFTDARGFLAEITFTQLSIRNAFFDKHTNLLYRRHFPDGQRVLIADGFTQMKNADYPPLEAFSDLHATFTERGMQGYGDFLTVGDNYSEGGGPAYAVAIHLTFIDPDQDNAMFVYHFKSDTNDTPTDPAGKFSQALNKLIAKLDSGNSGLVDTSAIGEFRTLHERGHFPGLGYVKKLSIKHHIETLAHYHRSQIHAG